MGRYVRAWMSDDYTLFYKEHSYKRMFKKVAKHDYWKQPKESREKPLNQVFDTQDKNYQMSEVISEPRTITSLQKAQIYSALGLLEHSISDLVKIKGISQDTAIRIIQGLEGLYKYKSCTIDDLPVDDEEHY